MARTGYRANTCAPAYGYLAAAASPSGQIEIDESQAIVVRQIFQLYADGWSARSIAARLNAEGVPSPGARWKRTKRRTDGKWLASAIHGDRKHLTGILNNRRYVGVIAWRRSEWRRSAADSSVRRQRLLEKASVERIDERLRIVPDEVWQQAKVRQELQARDLGVRVRTGLLGAQDWDLIVYVTADDYTLVTHNARDFRGEGFREAAR